MTNFNIEVQKCVEILNNGGIILYPTDTIYGIGSDSHNNKAIDRINKLKGSDSKKPLIHLMNSLEMVEQYVKKIPDFAKEYLNDKKPTTVIFTDLNKEKFEFYLFPIFYFDGCKKTILEVLWFLLQYLQLRDLFDKFCLRNIK